MTDDIDSDEFPPPKVNDAPNEIWLVYGDIERDCTHFECASGGDVYWCEDKQFDSDVKYVRADAAAVAQERERCARLCEDLKNLTRAEAVAAIRKGG